MYKRQDSKEGIELIGKIMKFITNASFQASSKIAAEKGSSPIYDEEQYMECPFIDEALTEETKKSIKENGLRNIAIMSIAPTGSISNIVLSYKDSNKNYIGVSGGVEPIFATHYTRRSESFNNQLFKVFHSTIQAYIDRNNLNDEIESSDNIESFLPDFMTRTAHKIDSENRVDIQGSIQKYVDHSISSTINLPEDVNPELISDVYLKAWRNKLKGVTIYRDGSRYPILSVEGEVTHFQEYSSKTYSITDDSGENQNVKGDEIIKMPDGSLTTVYHFIKNSTTNIEDVIISKETESVEA